MIKDNTHHFVDYTLKSSFYYGVSVTFVKFLVPVNVILVIASLTQYQYGVYKLAFSFFVVANSLLLSGVNGLVLNDSNHYFAKKEGHKAKRLLFEFFVFRIILGMAACALFYFLSQVIANHYSPGIAGYLQILAILFVTDAIITVTDIILKAKLDFLGGGMVIIVPEITKFFLICYFIFLTADGLNILNLFWMIFFSNIITASLLAIYTVWRLGLMLSIPVSSDGHMLPHLLRGSGKWALATSYVSSFTDSIRLWIIRLFISTEAVAIYSVAYSMVVTIKKLIPTQFVSSLIPRLIHDEDALRKIYIRSTKYAIWIYIGISITSFFVIPFFVAIFLPKYVVAVPYFRWLLFVIICNSMLLNKQIIYSLRKQRFLFLVSFVEIISSVAFGVLLIKPLGLYGAIAETLITEFIMAFIYYVYLCRTHLSLRFPWKSLFVYNSEDRYWARYLLGKLRSRFK